MTNSTDQKTICDLFHTSKITFVTSSMHYQNSVTNSTKTISIWIWLDLKTVEQAIIGSGNGHNFFVTISTANYGLFHKNFECDQFHTWSLVWPFPLFQLCLCPQLPLWPFPLNFLWLITFSQMQANIMPIYAFNPSMSLWGGNLVKCLCNSWPIMFALIAPKRKGMG